MCFLKFFCLFLTVGTVQLHHSSKIARHLEVTKLMKVFRIFDVFIRIWILGSVHWIRRTRILCFFSKFFCLFLIVAVGTLTSVLHQSSKIARHLEVPNWWKYSGSLTFWYGSGSFGSVHWIRRIRILWFFLKFFLLISYCRCRYNYISLTSVFKFKDSTSFRSHKIDESVPDLWRFDTDLDPWICLLNKADPDPVFFSLKFY